MIGRYPTLDKCSEFVSVQYSGAIHGVVVMMPDVERILQIKPSRLNGKASRNNTPVGTTKCLECRGEGRVLCMECDGTGEPNIEPQFLEWVDEGTKCPYCEGLGYTTCDTCFSTEMELTWIKLLVFMACLSFPLMVECRDRHYKFDVSHCSSTLALSAMMLITPKESLEGVQAMEQVFWL
ncbi:hypothetical protein Syun_001127 [Stephania yunnanensis]|uniref:Uncharacterized protein n=1 Tax=Stephania yunnanensis TaxID=152371 RepID=A0AAP0LD53_9MAGN